MGRRSIDDGCLARLHCFTRGRVWQLNKCRIEGRHGLHESPHERHAAAGSWSGNLDLIECTQTHCDRQMHPTPGYLDSGQSDAHPRMKTDDVGQGCCSPTGRLETRGKSDGQLKLLVEPGELKIHVGKDGIGQFRLSGHLTGHGESKAARPPKRKPQLYPFHALLQARRNIAETRKWTGAAEPPVHFLYRASCYATVAFGAVPAGQPVVTTAAGGVMSPPPAES